MGGFNKISLRWYRDQGRGQEAADDVGAEQGMDGSWPIAILHCESRYHERRMWQYLFKTFGVNAMAWYETVDNPEPAAEPCPF